MKDARQKAERVPQSSGAIRILWKKPQGLAVAGRDKPCPGRGSLRTSMRGTCTAIVAEHHCSELKKITPLSRAYGFPAF